MLGFNFWHKDAGQGQAGSPASTPVRGRPSVAHHAFGSYRKFALRLAGFGAAPAPRRPEGPRARGRGGETGTPPRTDFGPAARTCGSTIQSSDHREPVRTAGWYRFFSTAPTGHSFILDAELPRWRFRALSRTALDLWRTCGPTPCLISGRGAGLVRLDTSVPLWETRARNHAGVRFRFQSCTHCGGLADALCGRAIQFRLDKPGSWDSAPPARKSPRQSRTWSAEQGFGAVRVPSGSRQA